MMKFADGKCFYHNASSELYPKLRNSFKMCHTLREQTLQRLIEPNFHKENLQLKDISDNINVKYTIFKWTGIRIA